MNKQGITIYLTLLVLIAGCSLYSSPEDDITVTKILDVRILPNDTVQAGDSITFVCVVEDSLYDGFEYKWGLDNAEGLLSIYRTDTNSISIIATDPNEEELKSGSVSVSDEKGEIKGIPTKPERIYYYVQ